MQNLTNRWLLWFFLALVSYLHLNALWAPDIGAALNKAATFSILLLLAWTVVGSFSIQPAKTIAVASNWFVWGFIAGTGFISFEFLSGFTWRETLYHVWPAIRPGDNTITVTRMLDDGTYILLTDDEYKAYHSQDVDIQYVPSAANRNITLVLLFFWPALRLCTNLKTPASRLSILGVVGSSVLAISLSASQTVQVALILSAVVILAAVYATKFVHGFLATGWCLTLALVIPLTMLPYKLDLHNSDWLFESARDRVRIWDQTVRQTMKTPIFGTGIRATRFKSQDFKEERATMREPGDPTMPARLGRHAHNHFLQIWYELGAVGAVLFLALGLTILSTIKRLAEATRPYAYATFSAVCVIAAFGWGLWQTWLMAGYALAIVLMGLAVRITDLQKS